KLVGWPYAPCPINHHRNDRYSLSQCKPESPHLERQHVTGPGSAALRKYDQGFARPQQLDRLTLGCGVGAFKLDRKRSKQTRDESKAGNLENPVPGHIM